MEEIATLIQSMGFPIAACLALGYYVFRTNQDTRADFLSRENKLFEANKEMSTALNKSADAIREATQQHLQIIQRIGDVEDRVVKVEAKVGAIDINVLKHIDYHSDSKK